MWLLDSLSFEESIYVVSLALFGILTPAIHYFRKEARDFWSPLSILSLIVLYYMVAGPLLAIQNGESFFRLVDHRPFMIHAWRLCALGVGAMILGYWMNPSGRSRSETPVVPQSLALRYSSRLILLSLFALVGLFGTGGLMQQVDILDVSYTRRTYAGAFQNYLIHSMDFLIGAACLMLTAVLRKKTSWWFLVVLIVLAALIFTKQGFRWRLIVMGIGLFSTYYLSRNSKPSPILFASLTILGLLVMGFIGYTRTYGLGLDITSVEGRTSTDFILEGFGESSIFMTTGLLVEQVPSVFSHIGTDPMVQALALPVPRVLWPDKPSGEYIQIINSLYGDPSYGMGASILNFGEYYLAFGYYGVVFISFLLGYILKGLWKWYMRRKSEDTAIVAYSVGIAFLYVVLSRGYLPQVTMLFFFTVFPLWLIHRFQEKHNRQYLYLMRLKKRLDVSGAQ